MKIRTKLVIGFLSIASLVGILGLININTEKNINKHFQDISNIKAPRMLTLEKLKVACLKIVAISNNQIILESASGNNSAYFIAQTKNLEIAKNNLQVELDNFKELVDLANEQEIFSKLEIAKAELYLTSKSLIEANKNKINRQNITAKIIDLAQAEAKLIEIIDNAIAEEITAIEADNKLANQQASEAIYINIAGVIGVVLIANLIGLILAANIARPIAKIKQVASQLGQGKLDVKVDIKSTDEIGVLAEAFNQMVDNLKRTTVSKYYVDNIIRSMMDALIVLSPDAKIKTFNFAALLLLEYEDEELADKSIDIIFAEQDFFKQFENQTLMINSFIGRKETTLLTKNGKQIPVSFAASIMRDSDGKIQGIVCLAQDISKRKQSEIVLRRQALTFENISDGVVLTDMEGNIIDCNLAAEKMFGYEQAELLDKSTAIFYRPQEANVLTLLTLDGLRRTGKWSGENKFIRKDGSIGISETTVLPMRDERSIMVTAIWVHRDITERKQAEEALRSSEAKWRSLVENAPDIILTLDETGKILFINRNAPGLAIETAIDSSIYNYIPPEACGELQEVIEKVFSTGLAQKCEMGGIGSHGINEWYSVRIGPIFNKGKVVAATLIGTDISDRKQIEEALRTSEEKLESILESLNDVVWSIAVEPWEILYLNPATEIVYGRAVSEFLENPNLWFEVVHPEERGRIRYFWEQRLTTGANELEYKIIRPDGEVRWIHERGQVTRDQDGTAIRLEGISTDITERKRAEEALKQANEQLEIRVQERTREVMFAFGQLQQEISERRLVAEALRQSEERLNGILNSLNDVVWSAAANTFKILYISPAAEAIYGRTVSEFFEHDQLWIEVIHPEDITVVKQMTEDYLETNTVDIEYRIFQPNGTLRWLRNRWRLVYDSEGVAIRIDGIATDITNRKEAEEILRKSEAQATDAARIAQEQTQQLELTLKELQKTQAQLIQTEKMSSLGQLVAGVAHEINNPISFIYGNLTPAKEYIGELRNLLQLYQQHYPHPSSEIQTKIEEMELNFLFADLEKLLLSMQVGAERIRNIVLSLRNFSRLDESQMKTVDIHEGIENTLLILQHRLKSKPGTAGIEVIKEYGNLPKVQCYAGQLNQVFMNLLSNATDALLTENHQLVVVNGKNTQGTGVNSTLPTPTIKIQTEVSNNHKVVIRISDNGPGMTEQVRKRIFDPFFTTKPVGQGTGLGLSISYQIIVDKHGGELHCTSTPGAGAEFAIELPITQ